MSLTRRRLLAASGATMAASLIGRSAQSQPAAADRLVLLGTKGGPRITGYAPGPSGNVIVHKGVPWLVDAGYGVSMKLAEAGVPLTALRNIFITHHHSDHNIDLGPLLYNAWAGGLKAPVDARGPIGTKALLAAYWESNRFDIDTRIVDEGRPDLRRLVTAHDFGEGVVFESPDMKVTALRNLHPPIVESFAFRFEFAGKAIIFSGDTAYFPPLAEFAKGADYLIHEAMYGPALDALVQRNPNAATLMAHLKASHTLAEDVGRIAAMAGVKTLILSHLVPGDDKSITEQHWIDAVRPAFTGNVIVARDLMEIRL